MNSQYINPLLESTITVLTTMTMIEVTAGKPSLKTDNRNLGDITSTIDLAGSDKHGSLAISFSEAAIVNITEKMLGEKLDGSDETITDAVGEITNMITGSAKRIYSEQGIEFDLTRPTTVIGKENPIEHSVKGAVILIPFSTEAGPFYVEVCFN
ncbi:MAG: chemotaxis protein CheX [Pseudohongiellaceae bacterium]|jgi:chemotaxis protein CheX